MAKYISNTFVTTNYNVDIEYNLDTINLTENTGGDSLLTIRTDIINAENNYDYIEYDVVKSYKNNFDLTKTNDINLKLIEERNSEYILSTMYLCRVKEDSTTFVNDTNFSLSSLTNTNVYKYVFVLQFAIPTEKSINTTNNVYIITPISYNDSIVSKSVNFTLNNPSPTYTEIKDEYGVVQSTSYNIDSLNEPPILIKNPNDISELILRSPFNVINGTNIIIIFKDPLFVGYTVSNSDAKSYSPTITTTLLEVVPSNIGGLDTTDIDIEVGSGPINKNNYIGKFSGMLDSNIYINCHPIDDTGQKITKNNDPSKSARSMGISILFFGILCTLLTILYGAFSYKEFQDLGILFKKLFDSEYPNYIKDLNKVERILQILKNDTIIKWFCIIFIILCFWIFVGLNIDL